MHNSHLIKISFLLRSSPTPANIGTFEHANLQASLIPESLTFWVRVLLQSLRREFWIELSRCWLATVILGTHGYDSVNCPVSTASWYHWNLSIVLSRLSSSPLIFLYLWAHTYILSRVWSLLRRSPRQFGLSSFLTFFTFYLPRGMILKVPKNSLLLYFQLSYMEIISSWAKSVSY